MYLPSYDDKKIVEILQQIKEVRWQIFSKHSDKIIVDKNTEIYPVSNDGFIRSMITSSGVLCGAGFETPAEALFMGKKLMVIPMQNQYEQQCNAAALKSMGIPVIKKLKAKYLETIADWVFSEYRIEISYPDITEKIVNTIFESHVQEIIKKNKWDRRYNLLAPGSKKIISKIKMPGKQCRNKKRI